RLAGLGIHAPELGAFKIGAGEGVGFGVDDAELARETAVRVVRAADESAELAELGAEPAGAAPRAPARGLAPIFAWREEMRAQLLVELVEHLADAQLLGLANGGRECLPELAQHLAPVDAAARDVVELFLEMGGEVVLDVAREIGLQEGGDDAAAILRHEALA